MLLNESDFCYNELYTNRNIKRMEDNTNEKVSKEKAPDKARASRKGPLVALILIALVLAGAWLARDSFGTAKAATVNNEIITRAEYNARVNQIEAQYALQLQMGANGGSIDDPEIQTQIRNIAMDELVNETLFLQAAGAAGITITDEEVENELEQQRDSYPDEASYQADLREAGVTEEELRENIKNQLTIISYARSVIPASEYEVTDEELREVYELNYSEDLLEDSGGESVVPTLEEFSQTNREQFELQKLGMAVGPLVEELRAAAEIEIHVDLPSVETQEVPPAVTPEVVPNLDEETVESPVDAQNDTEEAENLLSE